MKFKPGGPRPPNAGRKKGTPNKITRTFQQFLDENGIFIPQKIYELMPKLDDREQMKVWLELMQYVFPKRKALEVAGEGGGPIQLAGLPDATTPEQLIETAKKIVASLPE